MSQHPASGPRPFEKPAWRPRLLVLLQSPDEAEARERLRQLGPVIAARYPDARVRFSVAGPETELTRSMVEFRGYELVDAVAEISWPVGRAIDTVDWQLDALRAATEGGAHIRTLIAGPTAVLLGDPAPNFVLMTGTRLDSVTIAEFRDWWLLQHAPLVERYCYPMAAYEQLHADRALSERLCGEAGARFRPTDAADSVYLDDVDAFFAQVGKPDITDLLREDELPFSDVKAGGLGMVGIVLFDTGEREDHVSGAGHA